MSRRKTIDGDCYYRARKVTEAYGIVIRSGHVFARQDQHGRPSYSACLMDEKLDFFHHPGLKFRAAKKLAKAWVAKPGGKTP